jgi:AraC-like DNA-binding protein
MNTTTHIDALSAFIFLGVTQGLMLSFFFILKSRTNIIANRYQGLLIFALSLGILEQLLNLTGYITKVLPLTNFSEPLNFVFGPLLYLFFKRSVDNSRGGKDWMHFIPFFFYLALSVFYFIQTPEYKYNSYVDSYHPDWPFLDVDAIVSEDPLGIREIVNELTLLSLVVYISLSTAGLLKKIRQSGKSFFRTDDEILRFLRNMLLHFIVIAVIFLIVKLTFSGDLGDYFIALYISFLIYLTSFRVMNDSAFFDRSTSFMDVSIGKYLKSSLTEAGKQEILDSIVLEMDKKRYFTNNLASLSELAKKTGATPHHVSQVINEKLGKNFFELLAWYRIEEAKKIISSDRAARLTVEEISEMVGYNSKTSFNSAFKRLTGDTPSEFRRSVNG